MKILIAHPKATCLSARKVAKALGADTYDVTKGARTEFPEYDLVWNYGSSKEIRGNHVINRYIAVQRCVDKVQTFEILRRYEIPTPDFTIFKHNVPDIWESIVIRDKRDGRKAEGLHYAERGDVLPDGELYSEYIPHIAEYRIVVGFGRILGRYRKDKVNDDWFFTLMDKQGFAQVDKHCIKAADALGIDYVGFDVLERLDGSCVILEANSGAIIRDEVLSFLDGNAQNIYDYIVNQ